MLSKSIQIATGMVLATLFICLHSERKDVATPPTMATPITVEAGVGRYYVEAEDGVVLIVRQRKDDSSIDIYAMRKENAR